MADVSEMLRRGWLPATADDLASIDKANEYEIPVKIFENGDIYEDMTCGEMRHFAKAVKVKMTDQVRDWANKNNIESLIYAFPKMKIKEGK